MSYSYVRKESELIGRALGSHAKGPWFDPGSGLIPEPWNVMTNGSFGSFMDFYLEVFAT